MVPGPKAEEIQAIGREGVAILKRWLEATTYLEFSWDAYDNAKDCIVPYIGGTKTFDLVGRYLTGEKSSVVVEAKRYTSAGGQYKEFKQFLRIAYSASLKDIEIYGRDRGNHYLWVTFHPFNLDHWSELEHHDHMRIALLEDATMLDGRPVSEDLLRQVVARVMVLVFNPKQEQLSLTKSELLKIRQYLERE